MKSRIIILSLLLGFTQILSAQKLISKNGHIWFYSHTPIEDIEAHNHQAVSILNPATGSIQFSLLIKSFEFKKKLMQEHFNENYMESDEYPKAAFTGIIDNLAAINFNKDGEYPAKVSGELTIHGVTRDVNIMGNIYVKSGVVNAVSSFMVSPGDYNISIPDLVRDHIAKEIEVSVDVTYNTN